MTLGNMREHEVHRLIAYCLNPACRHSARTDIASYPAETAELQRRAKCNMCGGRSVDVRPNWKEQPVKRSDHRTLRRARAPAGMSDVSDVRAPRTRSRKSGSQNFHADWPTCGGVAACSDSVILRTAAERAAMPGRSRSLGTRWDAREQRQLARCQAICGLAVRADPEGVPDFDSGRME